MAKEKRTAPFTMTHPVTSDSVMRTVATITFETEVMARLTILVKCESDSSKKYPSHL